MTIYDPKCDKCPLGLIGRVTCAPAKGPNTADPRVLFVVGDVRPEGEPWRLLQQACKEYGVESWALTSAVKCPIPDTMRQPRVAHVRACSGYLAAEIEAMRPEWVVPLGNVALKALTNATGITKFAGREWEIPETYFNPPDHTYRIFPMIDPAAVLHDERQLPAFESGFAAFQGTLAGETRALEYPRLSGIDAEATLAYIRDSGQPYALDLETTGINPRFNEIRTFAIATAAGEAFWCEWEPRLAPHLYRLLTEGGPMIAHNAVFEVQWLLHHVVAPLREDWRGVRWRVEDTLLLHHLLDENEDHRLTYLAKRYTPIGGYDDVMEAAKAADSEAYRTIDLRTLGNYNAGDADATFRIWVKFRLMLQKRDRKYGPPLLTDLYTEITEPAIWVVAHCELHGRKFDLRAAGELHKTLLAEEQAAMAKMLTHSVVKRFQADKAAEAAADAMARKKIALRLRRARKAKDAAAVEALVAEREAFDRAARKPLPAWGEYPEGTFNPNSAPQVTELVFDRLGAPVRGLTDSGTPSASEKFLIPVRKHHPFITVYLKWKKANTLRQRYLEKRLLPYVEKDGFVYGSYLIFGTGTGRWSSTSPNLQNIAPRLKPLFVSRFPGGSIVETDFAQLELRLMAWACGCEPLLEAFRLGLDPHAVTAERILGRPPADKEERKHKGKEPNFGLAYGAFPKRFAAEFGVSEKEAEAIFKAFHRAYPEIRPFIEGAQAHVQRCGWIKGYLGRIRNLPDHDHPDTKIRFHALLAGSNFPIQNLGAELTTWAFCRAALEVADRGLRAVPLGATHDSLTFDAPAEEVEEVARICQKWMTVELHKRFPWLDVPMGADPEAGPSWGELEAVTLDAA